MTALKLARLSQVTAAPIIALMLAVTAEAGPLLDGASEAERKAAAGDARGAFIGLHQSVAKFSASLPLTVPRALFVSEKPTGYGAYTPKKEPIFDSGEPLITYLEVAGLRWRTLEDGRKQSNFSVDLELSDDKGKTLALKKDFGSFTFTGHVEAQEIYTHLTLDVAGAAPGAYILRYTVNDIIAERSTPFEQHFTVSDKK
ncbi:hypothetical protein [Rhizobium sp. 18065]|uniref:hypothetical protein n=1 Tax=Rhizobium sp. 18065 TaxID=2681411 RepID=UPI0013587035|nr:hypothetical protein [Rhizobium sp. 18065]